jgi:hypothetical protein
MGAAASLCFADQHGTLDIDPAWANAAAKKKPMTADETRTFMKRLAAFVFEHHMKRDEGSPQRGMVYEYLDMARTGRPDRFVQGEALDTMHDGSWFAGALVNAYRATGDPYYKDMLTKWVLPFYLKMLNHSDELFTNKGAAVRDGAPAWDKPWAFQEGEKGFVPYYWDDGGSVSLERQLDHNPLPIRPSHDWFVGNHKPNPDGFLHGYSLGSSNHMAQDLAVMLQQSWLMLKDSSDEADRALAEQTAQAAMRLQESRVRHFGYIPACVAVAALTNHDSELMKRVPDEGRDANWLPDNHAVRALYAFKPGQKYPFAGFADDVEFRWYYGLAKAVGKPPEALAFKVIFDAYTEAMLYDLYCDDVKRPPGLNRFDLFPFYFVDGKPEDYRSQKKGHFGKPRPSGSRFGPQNMVACGWAIELLDAYPGVWQKGAAKAASKPGAEVFAKASEADVKAWLRRELAGGLRTWEAVFDQYGYIPTGMGTGHDWDHYSDTGGYAHLLSAAAQWLMVLDGKKDWEEQQYPR